MKHALKSTSIFLLALSLTACATQEKPAQTKDAIQGIKTEERAGVSAQGDAAAKVVVSQVTATMEAIDLDRRLVALVGPEGRSFVVQAGEAVRNLAQVKVGDKVTIEYYEGILAQIAPPGTPLDKVKLTDVLTRAALGERPAGGIGEITTATVVIQYVDTIRNVVHFTGPLGKTHIVVVRKPEFRAMLKNLKAGDQVTLSYFEALAVGVRPATN